MKYHAEGKIVESKVVDFGDYEVHIAFNTDDEGVAFRDWWESIGNNVFSEYFNKHKNQ